MNSTYPQQPRTTPPPSSSLLLSSPTPTHLMILPHLIRTSKTSKMWQLPDYVKKLINDQKCQVRFYIYSKPRTHHKCVSMNNLMLYWRLFIWALDCCNDQLRDNKLYLKVTYIKVSLILCSSCPSNLLVSSRWAITWANNALYFTIKKTQLNIEALTSLVSTGLFMTKISCLGSWHPNFGSCLWTMIDRTGHHRAVYICYCVTPQLLLSLRLGLWPSESSTSEIVAKRGWAEHFGDSI